MMLKSQAESQSSKNVSWDPHLIRIRRLITPSGNFSLKLTVDTMSRFFYQIGKYCASRPWEVMLTFLTLAICLVSIGPAVDESGHKPAVHQATSCVETSPWAENSSQRCHFENSDPQNTEESIMTIGRVLALLYIYYQLQTLYKLGSKYLFGLSALFTAFSSFIFCTGVVNFWNGNFSALMKALPFLFLLSDLSKASLLAQFALASSKREEIRANIARGMAILGPSLTLDTLVETLAIGVGTLSGDGFPRLEEISRFACLSVIVNYFVFITFFPACLSFALELSYSREGAAPRWKLTSLKKVLQLELEQKPNPVIQRVKVIMSAGLMLVHTLSRWPLSDGDASGFDSASDSSLSSASNANFGRREPGLLELLLKKLFAVGSEQIVMLGLVCVLAVKYIFFENRDNYNEHFLASQRQDQMAADEKENRETRNGKETPSIMVTCQDSDTESMIVENSDSKKQANAVSQRRGSIWPTPNSRPESIKSEDTNSIKAPSFFIGDDSSSDLSEIEFVDREVQTDEIKSATSDNSQSNKEKSNELVEVEPEPRNLKTLVSILNSDEPITTMTDSEIICLVEAKHIPAYQLESVLGDPERGVRVRRKLINKIKQTTETFDKVPYLHYDYSLVMGACCENVVGYVPVPLGVAGPLLLNGKKYYVPMATTEGCLVASTNRGCQALMQAGGVRARVYKDGMTRGPCVMFPNAMRAVEAKNWLEQGDNFMILKEAFDKTSRFGRLQTIQTSLAHRILYLRFTATTGDAMGMNMLSKGTEVALQKLQEFFPEIEKIILSGNFCTDKKPSAVNWIEGRGKSVVCEALIPEKIVRTVLKTNVQDMVDLNFGKNLIGSAVSGSIGGFNAHAANIVAATYIATGQDPAQTVGSSNCMTVFENRDGQLYITCTMPSMELGTVGGGTFLPAQSACLELIGVKGSSATPGSNAKELATVICGAVLAAELSLMAALAAGNLVRSHMKHNRSTININLAPTEPANNQPMLGQLSSNQLVQTNQLVQSPSPKQHSSASLLQSGLKKLDKKLDKEHCSCQ